MLVECFFFFYLKQLHLLFTLNTVTSNLTDVPNYSFVNSLFCIKIWGPVYWQLAVLIIESNLSD